MEGDKKRREEELGQARGRVKELESQVRELFLACLCLQSVQSVSQTTWTVPTLTLSTRQGGLGWVRLHAAGCVPPCRLAASTARPPDRQPIAAKKAGSRPAPAPREHTQLPHLLPPFRCPQLAKANRAVAEEQAAFQRARTEAEKLRSQMPMVQVGGCGREEASGGCALAAGSREASGGWAPAAGSRDASDKEAVGGRQPGSWWWVGGRE